MQKKSQDFSMEELARLAESPAGQQLLAMLRQSGGPQMQQAAEKAAKGDYGDAMALARKLMEDPQAQALLKQLGG